ncbi:MAG: Peptidase family [Planctomycetota bacterium]
MTGVRAAALLLILTGAGAADPLATAFAGRDPGAWAAAVRGALAEDGLDRTARRLTPWLGDRRDGVALLAWSMNADHRPPATAAMAALARPALRRHAARSLPGIATPQHIDLLDTAARHADPEVAAAALVALTHAGSATAGRAAAGRGLSAADPKVRARAAEWFRWHGTTLDLTVLAAPDGDAEARAVRQAAMAAIRHATAAAPAAGPAPWFRYGEGSDAALHRAAAALGERLRDLRTPPAASATRAGGIVEPVRGCFSDPPGSFALRVGTGAFAGGTHVGHDTGWHQPGAPVRAVMDGIVRVAAPALPSWGGLVVVEHDGPEGPVCSLYGHLGLLLAVRSGDPVAAGQLLGTLGRAMSPENGGYGVHLHLGLHRGPFADGGWVRGYLRSEGPGLDGWVDPIQTLARWRGQR